MWLNLLVNDCQCGNITKLQKNNQRSVPKKTNTDPDRPKKGAGLEFGKCQNKFENLPTLWEIIIITL
jgi:hypothetical protein